MKLVTLACLLKERAQCCRWRCMERGMMSQVLGRRGRLQARSGPTQRRRLRFKRLWQGQTMQYGLPFSPKLI